MGLLGMLAAGGAMGARDAADKNTAATNELELAQARNSMELDRESLRLKYLDKRYDIERKHSREDMQYQAQLNKGIYQYQREAKIEDDERNHRQRVDEINIQEGRRDQRFNKRLEVENRRVDVQANRAKGTGTGGSKSGSGAKAPKPTKETQSAQELVDSGEFKTLPEARRHIDIQKAIKDIGGKNPYLQEEDIRKKATERVDGLKPLKPTVANPTATPAPKDEETHYIRDPKTGKLIAQ